MSQTRRGFVRTLAAIAATLALPREFQAHRQDPPLPVPDSGAGAVALDDVRNVIVVTCRDTLGNPSDFTALDHASIARYGAREMRIAPSPILSAADAHKLALRVLKDLSQPPHIRTRSDWMDTAPPTLRA